MRDRPAKLVYNKADVLDGDPPESRFPGWRAVSKPEITSARVDQTGVCKYVSPLDELS